MKIKKESWKGMSNKKKTVYTNLVCLFCGNISVIQRKASKLKKDGHLKVFYCPCCKNVFNHYEIRDISKFMLKYDYSDLATVDDTTKYVYELLEKRVDMDEQRENRVFKKILTRK